MYTVSKLQTEATPDLGARAEQKLAEQNQVSFLDFYPRLACQVNLYKHHLILSQKGQEFAFPINEQTGEELYKLLALMDGRRSLHELQQLCSPENSAMITTLVESLDAQGLLDNAVPIITCSGAETLIELETFIQTSLEQILDDYSVVDNQLWQLLQLTTSELSDNIIYGFVLEHYHLFSQLDCFQSSVLGLQGSNKIRYLLNELYAKTYKYGQLLEVTLSTIDISSEQLTHILPLPETMALYHGLIFWANFDSIFFLSILGILLDRVLTNLEHYLLAIDRYGVDGCFLTSLQQLIETQQEHIILARSIFQKIPHIDLETKQRLKGQTHLFMEIYCNFYRAIGQHYANTPTLLSRLSVTG